VAEHVVQALLARGAAGKKVLVPRAKVAREVLPEELAAAGCDVRVLPVYETGLAEEGPDAKGKAELVARLEAGEVHFVTFTSSSTVENFFKLLAPDVFKAHRDRLKIACIGPVTARTLASFGFTADIQPGDYTIPGLVEALVRSVADAGAGAE